MVTFVGKEKPSLLRCLAAVWWLKVELRVEGQCSCPVGCWVNQQSKAPRVSASLVNFVNN